MLRPTAILLAALAITGCDGSRSASAYTVRDSAGISISESASPAWSADEGWSISAEPHVDIGGEPRRTGHDLYEVNGVVLLSDGTIAVANSGSHEVRIFNPDGELLRTLGRAGDGPGEFRSIRRLFRLPGDSLVVSDFSLDRITVFSPTGDLARTAPLQPAPEGGIPSPAFQLDDGTLLARPGFSFSGGQPTGVYQDTIVLTRYSVAGAFLGELARVPGPEFFVYSEGGNTLGGTRTWGRNTHTARAGDGFIVGYSGDYSYDVRGPRGELLRIVRANRPPRAVTGEHIAQLREPSPEDEPANAALWQRVLDAMDYPTHFPAYAAILTGDDGHVWIRDYVWPDEGAASQWQIFDPEGRWLGSVEVPAGFEVLHIEDDQILGTFRDDMDVEHVQAWRLIRPGKS